MKRPVVYLFSLSMLQLAGFWIFRKLAHTSLFGQGFNISNYVRDFEGLSMSKITLNKPSVC